RIEHREGWLGDHHGRDATIVEVVRVGDARLRDLPGGLDRDHLSHTDGNGVPALLEFYGLDAGLDPLELLEPVGAERRVAAELGLLEYIRPPDVGAQRRQYAVDLAPVERAVELREQPDLVVEGHVASVTPR